MKRSEAMQLVAVGKAVTGEEIAGLVAALERHRVVMQALLERMDEMEGLVKADVTQASAEG